MKKEKPTLKNKKTWWKWLLGIFIVLLVFGTFQYFKIQKATELRREVIQVQEIKLREFYQDQGLSEKEIEEKLKENRDSNFPKEDNVFKSVMRTVRHTTGTGGTPMKLK